MAFQYGFILGRFQHVHLGHEKMIDTALEVCSNVLLFVGSAQLQGTLRNPYGVELRMELLRKIYGDRIWLAALPDYTHEGDHSHDWGRYLLGAARQFGREHALPELDLMIYGNDEERESWFPQEEMASISRLILPRAKLPINATRLREALASNDREFWERYVNASLYEDYERLRDELLLVKEYRDLDSG